MVRVLPSTAGGDEETESSKAARFRLALAEAEGANDVGLTMDGCEMKVGMNE
jgi:hypothetical protein